MVEARAADQRRELYLDRAQRLKFIEKALANLGAFLRGLCQVPLALAGVANSALPTAFVPVQLPPAETAPADIRIELSRGTTTINVSWPCSAASQCAASLRELLR